MLGAKDQEFAAKEDEIYQAAYSTFSETSDWVTFFRKVLGVGGIVPRTFPKAEDRIRFEATEAYVRILQMLTELRKKESAVEPVQVITIRLPKSVHETLRAEADFHNTSMQKLCVSKLLQSISDALVPKVAPEQTPPRKAENEEKKKGAEVDV